MKELVDLLESLGFEIMTEIGDFNQYWMPDQKIPKFKGWRKVCRVLKSHGVRFLHKGELSGISTEWWFKKSNTRKDYSIFSTELTCTMMVQMYPELQSIINRNAGDE